MASGMTRREILRAGAMAVGALAGWGGSARAQAGKLRVGYNFSFWSTTLIYAVEEGLFERAGLTVDARAFDSGKAVRDAMIARAIDVGMIGGTPFVVGAAKGDLVGIAVLSYGGKSTMVVARKGSGIVSVADLKGKKVGLQVGSTTGTIFLEKVAPKFGLKKGDYQVYNIAFGEHVAALAAGSVDAIVSDDPRPAVAEHQGIGVGIINFSDFDILPAMLAAHPRALQEQPEAIVRMLRAWLGAVKVFHADRRRVVEVMQRSFTRRGVTMPLEVVEACVNRVDVGPEITPAILEYFNDQAKILRAQGALKEAPDFTKLLRPEFLQRAKEASS